MLVGARAPDLKIEIEGVSSKMSASVQQYQIVEPGSPQGSRRLEVVGRIDLDAATAQDAGARVAGTLAGVDEEDFLAIED